MKLVPFSENGLQIPADSTSAGLVLCIPGSTVTGYEGWGALAVTPEALVLVSPMGLEELVPLWGIVDSAVVKFEGVLIKRTTSVGEMLSPLPYPHGIEVCYSLEMRLKLRLRVVTVTGNAAHTWTVDIRRAARQAQLGDLSRTQPRRQSAGKQ